MGKIHKLPVRHLGLENIPAVPFEIGGLPETLVKLGGRAAETKPATHGLSNLYTIGGTTAPAYPFLFGESEPKTESEGGSGAEAAKGCLLGLVKKLFGGGGSRAAESAGGGGSRAGRSVAVASASAETAEGEPAAEEPASDTSHRADRSAAARAALRGMLEQDADSVRELLEETVKRPRKQPPKQLRVAAAAAAAEPTMTGLSLDDPEQFAMSWTNFGNVYRDALPHLPTWAATLTDADEASRQFWPTIADYGLAYNLLIVKKIGELDAGAVGDRFGDAWSAEMDDLRQQGLLYVIDLGIFESVEPQQADGAERFTPATLTLLSQDPATKALTPIAVRVSGHDGKGAQIFVRGQATDSAWLWALQAAKVSITVWGIWLGHVYHWHVVTAAMQMTMHNTFSDDHPIRQLLAPQSDYLIPFDVVLLLLWDDVAPPTSITSGNGFLELCNTFADGRDYFDDDPTTTLERLGVRQEDFTVDQPWDRYVLVRQLLDVWKATGDYVEAFVESTYADDAAVVADRELQKWIEASSDEDDGNIRGLPAMTSRAALIRVLTSLVYRVTVHGNARLSRAANPALSFVANYPPCLHRSKIPEPSATIDTRQLLRYLPKTGILGKMLTFYFTFGYSAPYVPFVPLDGVREDLFFPGGLEDPRNQALVAYRQALIDFMEDYEGGPTTVNQWPLNIET